MRKLMSLLWSSANLLEISLPLSETLSPFGPSAVVDEHQEVPPKSNPMPATNQEDMGWKNSVLFLSPWRTGKLTATLKWTRKSLGRSCLWESWILVSKTQKPFSITWRQCTGVFRPNTVQIYLQSQVYTQEKALIRKDMASQN